MDADDRPDLRAGRADAYPCKADTHAIIGCAFEVLNELGHGLHEKCYENALVVEFKRRGIPCAQQRRFRVDHKGEAVGEFVPDLVCYEKVIADPKVIEQITNHERGQMLNYLKVAQLPVGLILNFRHARLEWERIVLALADANHLR